MIPEKTKQILWLNVFIRDFLLIIVVGFLQYWTHFNSKVVFLITGMLMVLISWQLSDYLDEKKRLQHGNL